MRIGQQLRAFGRFLSAAGKTFSADHLSAYAAQVTFYFLLAGFPFVTLICMAGRALPFLDADTLRELMGWLMPERYQTIGTALIDGYYNAYIGATRAAWILFLVWSASRLIQALMNGFNTAYGVQETRTQMVLRLIGCLYTVALCMIFVAMIVMYTFGTRLVSLILEHSPNFVLLELLLGLIRNLAAPALLLVLFWLSYVFLPSRKTRFRYEFPGACLTAAAWRIAAALYGLFLERSIERYSYVYGSLAGVVMILIWLYTCVYIWFIGAELNEFVRKQAESGAFDKYRIRLPESLSVRRKRYVRKSDR